MPCRGDNPCVVRSRLWLLPLLLAVMVLGGWWFGFRADRGNPELPVYVTGGERMALGQAIYQPGTDAKPFSYPPFSALVFVPFAWVPANWQPAVWFGINFWLLLAAIGWLHRWAMRDWPAVGPPRVGWLWAIAAVLAARHVFSVFENQSHDLLVLLPMVFGAAMWCRGSGMGVVGAGIGVGIGAAFKATPLLALELFLVRRSWLAIAALLATFGLLSWLPDWLFPQQSGGSWLWSWYEVNLRGLGIGAAASTEGVWGSHSILNQSLSGTLTRILSQAPADASGPFVLRNLALMPLGPAALRAAILLGQLGVVAWIGWGVLRARANVHAAPEQQQRLGLGEFGLVLCGMVLLSPQSSKAHFCVLLVPAVFCADRLLRAERCDRKLLVLLAISALLGLGSVKGILGKNAGNYVLGMGAVTWSTVAMLLASLRALRGPSQGVAL